MADKWADQEACNAYWKMSFILNHWSSKKCMNLPPHKKKVRPDRAKELLHLHASGQLSHLFFSDESPFVIEVLKVVTLTKNELIHSLMYFQNKNWQTHGVLLICVFGASLCRIVNGYLTAMEHLRENFGKFWDTSDGRTSSRLFFLEKTKEKSNRRWIVLLVLNHLLFLSFYIWNRSHHSVNTI